MSGLTFPEAARTGSWAGGSLALATWRRGFANRPYGTVSVVAIGSSTTQGLNASALDRRWVDLLGSDLHARYNPSGVTGGRHILGLDSGWAYTGTHGTDSNGIALQSITLAASATMGRTVDPCTGFDVHYAQGPGAGAFTVSVDGGGAVTVTPDTNGTANRHDGVYSSPTVTVGSHSILITATAATVISGVYARNGDETAGIRVYNSGLSGTNSTNWAGASASLMQRFNALSPRLFLIMLAANDYSAATSPATFRTNIQTLVDRIVGSVTPTPSILLLGTYARLDVFYPTYTWQQYLAAMQAVAAANPGVVEYADISAIYPASQDANVSSLLIDTADNLHQTDKGHRAMGDRVRELLDAPPPAAVAQPAFSPLQVSGLLARFDASTISQSDNTAVASWAPATGVETAALAQATSGNQPVFRTGRVNGRPSVVFTAASSHNLATATWAGKRSTPLTVITVFKLVTGQTGNLYSGQSGVYVYAGNNGGTTLSTGAGATAEINGTVSQNAWHVLIAVYNGASSAQYLDSHTATQSGTTSTGSSAALPGLRLGTNSTAASQFLDGEIADQAIYGKACTAAEITALANWYGARYGVAIA